MSRVANAKFAVTNLFDVTDWTVVVTGGATGIGLMLAQSFANNGAHVYIVGRREEPLANAVKTWGEALFHPKGRMTAVCADVRDKEALERLVGSVKAERGSVDVLVNNAGVTRDPDGGGEELEGLEEVMEKLWKQKVEDWEEVYKTNVVSHFFTAVAFGPLLSAAARQDYTPAIINISSVEGFKKTSNHYLIYNVSKAAAIHLNTLLAEEFTQSGIKIRVNSIAPGLFPAEMTTTGSDGDSNKSQIPEDRLGNFTETHRTPAGRPGNEKDMAQTALFLACNQYMYGQTIILDGGKMLKEP